MKFNFLQLTPLSALVLLVVANVLAKHEPDLYKGAVEPATKPEVYGQGVRETPWQTPADEARGFHLPPGFMVELVASEPQIAKPLNMAFDHRGRLWVTCTVEYPYPAEEGRIPRDTIKILEDTNCDGSFESVKTFADELNIPIGLLPVEKGVICFSIPNIWWLKDNDGDDRVDERIKLLGPFDTTRDTHGMINALRQGSDGWIYACHGFNNRSSVTATDGSKVELNSGNTFRFLPDGSRIEQFTYGQVNPFGMCSDEWGNWFSADCHSKPLTALLAGACYPSFGRPHDGLGFAPSMMDHLHGSTAICGLEYYQAEQFPRPYRNLFYSGNVMTSRINCNTIVRKGATLQARELVDFMTSEDPWFRPVDIQQGPDGALYVADFYNKIIGHYEVPLTHPDRDRESGRIWRISYRGEGSKPRLFEADAAGAVSDLTSTNFRARKLAIQAELIANGRTLAELERTILDENASLPLRQSAVEILALRLQLSESMMAQLLNSNSAELIVQVLRIACGWKSAPDISSLEPNAVLSSSVELLSHSHAEVAKAAAETLGRWGSRRQLPQLISAALGADQEDPVLIHAFRIAIKNILYRDTEQIREYSNRWKNEGSWAASAEAKLIAGVLPGVADASAAQALLEYVASQAVISPELRMAALEHAAKYPDEDLLTLLLSTIIASTQGDPNRRAELIVQVSNTYPPNTKNESTQLRDLARLTMSELYSSISAKIEEEGPSMQWLDGSGKSWGLEPRKCSDGQAVQLLSSLSRGEQYVGQLSSEAFICPTKMSLWIAGHNGYPDKPDHQLNSIALVHATSGQRLMQAFPPRSDVAAKVEWNLAQYAGREVKLKIEDGDKGNAYAWLGVSRISIPALQVGSITKSLDSVAGLLKLGFGDAELVRRFVAAQLSPRQRATLIMATLEGQGALLAATLAQQALALSRPDLVNDRLYGQELTDAAALAIAQELCSSATGGQQSALGQALLKSQAGCELLAEVLQAGWLNPASLRGKAPLLPSALAADKRDVLQKYITTDASALDTALVSQRLADLNWNQADAARGKQLFTQHCANCHQLAGQGAVIGPQLDGAVKRSVERMAEDILLPNLNVDKAFRSTTFLLEDGSIQTGLVRQENDQTIELIGSDAKIVSFALADVVERKQSEQSLMPANMSEVLNQQQLADLLLFLSQSR